MIDEAASGSGVYRSSPKAVMLKANFRRVQAYLACKRFVWA